MKDKDPQTNSRLLLKVLTDKSQVKDLQFLGIIWMQSPRPGQEMAHSCWCIAVYFSSNLSPLSKQTAGLVYKQMLTWHSQTLHCLLPQQMHLLSLHTPQMICHIGLITDTLTEGNYVGPQTMYNIVMVGYCAGPHTMYSHCYDGAPHHVFNNGMMGHCMGPHTMY